MNALEKIREPEALPATVTTPMGMIEKALASGATPETLEKLMLLQERWEANQARKDFDAAIAAAKVEIPVILKTRKVDFTTSKGRTNYNYEDLASIAQVIDPILSRNGLSYRFRTKQDGRTVVVTCIISHVRGHREETELPGAADETGNKNSIQAIGSTVTYLQRYTLKAALGIAVSNDTDGATRETIVEGSATVTPDEFIFIRDLIEKTGAIEEKVLASVKASDLETMTQKQYREAVSKLQSWAKARAQNATGK